MTSNRNHMNSPTQKQTISSGPDTKMSKDFEPNFDNQATHPSSKDSDIIIITETWLKIMYSEYDKTITTYTENIETQPQVNLKEEEAH